MQLFARLSSEAAQRAIVAGKRHAPEGDLVDIDRLLGEQEGQGVGVVGYLFGRVDVMARLSVTFA